MASGSPPRAQRRSQRESMKETESPGRSGAEQEAEMNTPSRREFLGGLAATLALSRLDWAAEVEAPQLVLYNANILTVDARNPRARAMQIANGRIRAIGKSEDVLPLATAETKKTDLEGKTVVPGFIDAHSHPAEAGLSHLRMVDCDVRSIAEIQAAIRE